MYICICNGITDRAIRDCAKTAVGCSLRDLECSLGVGASCGRCRDAAAEILAESQSQVARPAEVHA
ncbi:MAG: (2Fe-2S)-binding protein [Betaproteobacteria bacterium]